MSSPEFREGALRCDHQAMACTWQLLLRGDDPVELEGAAQAAFTRLDELESELSRFVPDSDVSRLNRQPPGVALRVGWDTFECLRLAAELHEWTGGAFDVCLGSGHEGLVRDAAQKSVLRIHEEVQVDLGGIGKGYAVDQIIELLGDWDVCGGLVHSGQSTIAAFGETPENGWTVALRDPRNHDQSLAEIRLENGALSGSGVAIHGEHIVDPRSGEPGCQASGTWALAPRAAVSDALATTAMVLSPAELEAVSRCTRVTFWVTRGDAVVKLGS